MEQVKDNETYAFDALPPMREFYERETKRIPIRIGPDWAALVSNWFTQWERTNDPVYLEKFARASPASKPCPSAYCLVPQCYLIHKTKPYLIWELGILAAITWSSLWGAASLVRTCSSAGRPRVDRDVREFGWFYSLSPERKAEESNGY